MSGMGSVLKAMWVVGGGVVACYAVMFAVKGYLATHLGPFAVVLPVVAGAGVWYFGVRYWIDWPARTVLERRRMRLCERCGYDPRGNAGGCARSVGRRS
jgi:hypothetical protein